jgi:hypothetical protein
MAGPTLKLLVLKTRQVDRLRAFYHALGVELVEDRHGEGTVHYASKIGDAVLEIYPLPDEGGTADATTRLGFAVEWLAEVVQALREGGTVIGSTSWRKPWAWRPVSRSTWSRSRCRRRSRGWNGGSE